MRKKFLLRMRILNKMEDVGYRARVVDLVKYLNVKNFAG